MIENQQRSHLVEEIVSTETLMTKGNNEHFQIHLATHWSVCQ